MSSELVQQWALKHLGVDLVQMPTNSVMAKKWVKRYGKLGSNLCQGMVMDDYMQRCGGYQGCKGVEMWAVHDRQPKNRVVGIMMMAKQFQVDAHYWGTGVNPGFHPDSKDFPKNGKDVSDLLVVCSKNGPAGLGQLLVLLALTRSKRKGLFAQVGLVMTSTTLEADRLTFDEAEYHQSSSQPRGTTFLVSRPMYAEAAYHIYTKFGFRAVKVLTSSGRRWTSLYFFRKGNINDAQLKEYLKLVPHAGKRASRQAQRRSRKLQTQLWTDMRENFEYNEPLQQDLQDWSMETLDFSSEYDGGDVGLLNLSPSAMFGLEDLNSLDPNNLNMLDYSEPFPSPGPNMLMPFDSDLGDVNFQAELGSVGGAGIVSSDVVLEPLSLINQGTLNQNRTRRQVGILRLQRVTCGQCEKVFTRPFNMRRHENLHNPALRQHQCTICSYCTFRKQDLQLHIDRKHKKLRPYQCNFCPHRSGSLSDKYKHHKDRHESIARPPKGQRRRKRQV